MTQEGYKKTEHYSVEIQKLEFTDPLYPDTAIKSTASYRGIFVPEVAYEVLLAPAWAVTSKPPPTPPAGGQSFVH